MASGEFECKITTSFSAERQISGDFLLENKLKVSFDDVDVQVFVKASSPHKDKLDVDAFRELMYQFLEVLTDENDAFPNLDLHPD